MIFSSGVDRKTIRYRQLVNGKWVYVDGKCFHQHDVRAMASYESEQMRMTVSGGISRLFPH
jgi:U3 small nucleolar RNA-associated protein 4